MGRPKKTETNEAVNPEIVENEVEQTAPETEKTPESEPLPSSKTETKTDIPANVEKLMRLYPQYEEIWITPRGFVHPVGVPEYLLKGAKLYKNIFYNK